MKNILGNSNFGFTRWGIALIATLMTFETANTNAANIAFGSTAGSAWLTSANWTGSTAPTSNDVAQFGANPTSGTTGVGVNAGTSSTISIQAIEILSTRAANLLIGNSSGSSADLTMTLTGATINSAPNVVLRNNSAYVLTLQNTQGSGGKLTTYVLGNSTDNVLQIDGTGGVTISSVISGVSKKLTVSGTGAGVVTLSGINTYSGDTTVNNKLTLSGSGSIANSPNIILASGSTLNVSGLTTAFSLGSSQALKVSATGSSSTATLTVATSKDATLSTGGILFTAIGSGFTTAPLTVASATGGALALNSAPVTVTTTTALAAGTYKLVAKSGSATGVTGTPGALTVNGSGLAPATAGALSVSNGELILTVAAASPTITPSGTPTALSTTYGAASSNTSFTVSGSSLNGTTPVVVTPPAGFEVATTSDFSTTIGTSASGLSLGTSTVINTTIYVRLAATATVSSSPYSGNIVISGGGATSQNVATASSTVSKRALTITAANQTVPYGTPATTVTAAGGYTPTGFVNGDNASVVGGTISYTTTYTSLTAVGSNVATISPVTTSLTATNYSFISANGDITVAAVIPSAPTITGITAGNGQLSVFFNGPTSNGGAGITNYEYSTNGGTDWTVRSPVSTESPLLMRSLSNGTNYNVQIRAVNSAGGGTSSVSTLAAPMAPSSPTITVYPDTFGGAFSTTYGTASSPQTFTVSGSALSANLVVTAPTGFEISRSSGSGFAESLNLAATSGSVAPTTIYVRLKATAAAGSYNSASIGVSGGGATAQSVATTSTGNVVGQAALTITGIGIANKVYDRATSATITGTAAYGGLQNGENLSVSGTPSASFATPTVGLAKPVDVTGYETPSPNYTLAQPILAADISAVGLTVTGATVISRPYNGNTYASITGAQLIGVISPDEVILIGGSFGTFENSNVGTGIAVSTSMEIAGADAQNYSFTAPTGFTGEITKATAEITFEPLPSGKKVGDATFSAGATTSVGTLSYSSSNPNVATVDGSGNITPVAPGVTTITANVAGAANFTGATASRTLNVGAAGASGAIATWTFETSAPSASATTISSIAAEVGTGTASGRHANSSAWSSPVGNGSAKSFSANTWASGDYFQFQVSTTGRSGISFSFDANRSNTGPASCKLQYSTDGTSYTDYGSVFSINAVTSWSSTSSTPSRYSFDLSSISNINNQGNVYFRIVATAPATGNTGSGSFRVDNVSVNYSETPRPSITTNGAFSSALSTTYGTASAASATTVTVTGGSLTAEIVATAPSGFEVSNDGATYGATASFAQTGGFANGTLYLRLAANAAVGLYSGNVVLSSTGAAPVNVATATSTVTNSTVNPLESYLAVFGLISGTDAAAGTADPDGDGMDNNAEFAFGTSPISGASRAVTLSTGIGEIKLTYLQRNSGVTYTVKSLPDLTTAFDSGTTVIALEAADQTNKPNGYTRYEATLSTTAAPKGFLRVRANLP
jgi:hypothetical protein